MSGNNIKTYPLISAQVFRLAGLTQLVFLFLMLPLATVCFGDPALSTNSIPWSDDFETYTNLTPLIDGTNGWYASAGNVVVQTNTVRTGTNAAMIPTDCTLSNRFATNTTSTNVWIQMDAMLSLYDGTNYPGTNYPMVDNNAALLFYVNTNWNFVVLTNRTSDADNSSNWVVLTSVTTTNTWTRLNIYEDFTEKRCFLYANGTLVTTNALSFINTDLTNFAGFDIYNGAVTSYLDNVSVVVAVTNSYPPLIVTPATLSTDVFVRVNAPYVTPADQTVKVINVWSDPIGFLVRTNQDWISALPTNGTVLAHSESNVVLTYTRSTEGWAAGVSNATITIVATNGTEYWGTQTVQVAVNMVVLSNALSVVPTWFSNNVWLGATPTSRTFEVRNPGNLSFVYAVETGVSWLSSSSPGGTLGALSTNTITNTYGNTALWSGPSNDAYVNVVATNGGVMVTQRIDVAVNTMSLLATLYVSPTNLTNSAWRGDRPTNQTFIVSNMSDASFYYNVTTGADWITSLPTGGTLAACSGIVVTQSYRSTFGWEANSSSWVKVTMTNGSFWKTQDVAVTVNIMNFAGTMVVVPPYLTNMAWIGDTPTSQTFKVSNTGDISFVYTTAKTAGVSGVTAGGAIPAKSTNTITVTYTSTWEYTANQPSNMTLKVISTNGCGDTQFVYLVLNIYPAPLNYYVATNGFDNNISPYTYTNWTTAASNLTSAVYKANFYTNVGSTVWLSNGVYNLPATQVTLSNVTVRSVNGAESVKLNGTTLRGFYLAHTGAALNSLTITNCRVPITGTTNGGAVFVSTGLVWNCRLLGNSATNGGAVAVGAAGIVRDCLIWGNKATNGGGVYYDAVGGLSGLVENCTIASNYAVQNGGGLYTSTNMTGLCVNAVVYSNTVGSVVTLNTNWGTNTDAKLFFTNSCVTTPDVVNGVDGSGNIANNPRFVGVVTGNCRLVQGSPCINAGTNQAWMTRDAVDLAGNLRVRFGRVDIGAYEWYSYQGMGIKVNGVRYEKIRFINGAEPLQINGITNSI